MKTNYTIEIQRRNITPAQFLAYVRRRLKATGGDMFCGCLDLDYFAAGSEPNYDTERDGTHCISRSKPYSMQTYIRQDGRLYNEICEFEFDDEKTGHGYYYLIDAEEETTETDTDTAGTTDTTETEQDTQNAEQTTETAPAAEPETAEAEQTADAKHNDRIAEIIRDIRASRATYRAKERTTIKAIRDDMRAGMPTVTLGYCEMQSLLSCANPVEYTAGLYGWNFDVYRLGGLTICTGYRGMVGKHISTATADRAVVACDWADLDTRERMLAEWIYNALAELREGARV